MPPPAASRPWPRPLALRAAVPGRARPAPPSVSCRIIAVSYEARAFGVSRGMWATEARALCPELALARVPQARGKADLTR